MIGFYHQWAMVISYTYDMILIWYTNILSQKFKIILLQSIKLIKLVQ